MNDPTHVHLRWEHVLPLVLALVESAEWHQYLSSIAAGQTNAFNPGPASNHATRATMALEQECIAILPLPYFHKGSEIWDTPADERLANTTMTASFLFVLPTMASIMSRTSLSETIEQLSSRSPFPHEKPRLEALTKEGYLLLVFLSLMLFFVLGVLSMYIGRSVKEIQKRSIYLVKPRKSTHAKNPES